MKKKDPVTGEFTLTLFSSDGRLARPASDKFNELIKERFMKPGDEFPQDGDFLNFPFRNLSATIVGSGTWKSCDFSESVLRNAVKKLNGVPIYYEHNSDASGALGAVAGAKFNNGYTLADGTVVPAGIDSLFVIDRVLHPEVCRKLNAPVPSLRFCSVSVTFKWVASHNFDNVFKFYDNIGTVVDGSEVRRIVSEISHFSEVSFVNSPADKFASHIGEDGKIMRVAYSAADADSETNKQLAYGSVDFSAHGGEMAFQAELTESLLADLNAAYSVIAEKEAEIIVLTQKVEEGPIILKKELAEVKGQVSVLNAEKAEAVALRAAAEKRAENLVLSLESESDLKAEALKKATQAEAEAKQFAELREALRTEVVRLNNVAAGEDLSETETFESLTYSELLAKQTLLSEKKALSQIVTEEFSPIISLKNLAGYQAEKLAV